jgi:beta-lactam-binding protein with PASTA domain
VLTAQAPPFNVRETVSDTMKLITELIVLVTAVIGLLAALNKTDTVSVPVVREVAFLNPSGGSGTDGGVSGGDGGFPTIPAPTKIAVPDVTGLSERDAQGKLEDVDLHVQRVETIAITVCAHESGEVEYTLPPAGVETMGDSVVVYVCG